MRLVVFVFEGVEYDGKAILGALGIEQWQLFLHQSF